MWRTPADGPANELNLPAMRPYLEGADGAGSTIGRPWFCPSTSVANIDSGIGYPVEWLDYAYYSMSTRPDPAWCTDPAAMFCPRLNPTGLLMSDRVVHWGSADLWFYNHTRRGSNYGFTSTAQFVGANQLFGDGHAAWKPAGAFGPLATSQWFGDICGDHCYF
jgi:prepilin-type processing-associated H-X9-DG protein